MCPWPHGVKARDAAAAADASISVMSERARATQSRGKRLTAVCNAIDDGAFGDLRAAHLTLDQAVLFAYCLPLSLRDDDSVLLDALLDLNEAAAANPEYAPFAARTMDDDTP